MSFWEENQHNFSSFRMERFEKSTYEFLKDLSRSWNFKLNWWFCMLRLSWRDKQEASLRDHKQWVWRIASDFWEVFAIVFTSKIFSNFCRNALKSSNISLCRGRLRCELRLRHSDADIFTSLIICLQIWPGESGDQFLVRGCVGESQYHRGLIIYVNIGDIWNN